MTGQWNEADHPRDTGRFTEKAQHDPGAGVLGGLPQANLTAADIRNLRELGGILAGGPVRKHLDRINQLLPEDVEIEKPAGYGRILGRYRHGQWRRLSPELERFLTYGDPADDLTPAVLLAEEPYSQHDDPGDLAHVDEVVEMMGEPADWLWLTEWHHTANDTLRQQLETIAKRLPELRDGRIRFDANRDGNVILAIDLGRAVGRARTNAEFATLTSLDSFEPPNPHLGGYPTACHYADQLIDIRNSLIDTYENATGRDFR